MHFRIVRKYYKNKALGQSSQDIDLIKTDIVHLSLQDMYRSLRSMTMEWEKELKE